MGQKVTLYHGTDARIISMSHEERTEYLCMVDRIISKYWEVYKKYYTEFVPKTIIRSNGEVIHTYLRSIEQFKDSFSDGDNINIYYNLLDKLAILEARYNGSGYFQYGGLYLAATKERAESYARRSFAGGELGLIAYRLIEAMNILDFQEWKPDCSTLDEVDRIVRFATGKDVDPVIITIDNIDSSDLLDEQGGEPSMFFDFLNNFGQIIDSKFRYKGDLDLSRYPIEHISTAKRI